MKVEKCDLSVEDYQITAHLLSSKDGKVFEAYSIHMFFDERSDETMVQRMVPVGFEQSRLPILAYDRESNEIRITYRLDQLTMKEVLRENDLVGALIEYRIGDRDFRGEIAHYLYEDGKIQLNLCKAESRPHLKEASVSQFYCDEWYSLSSHIDPAFQIDDLREELDGKVSFSDTSRADGRVIIAFKPKE